MSLLAGCAQDTPKEHADPNNQADFGPVPANYRKPVKLPPFPEPSFERLIEQFKADVTANKGDPELLKRKKQAIENPDLLWDYSFKVPHTIKYEDIPRPEGYNPTRDKVRFYYLDDNKNPIVSKFPYESADLPEIKVVYPYIGKTFYITKEQQERMDALRNTFFTQTESTSIHDSERISYYRNQSAIFYEGIDTLSAAKDLSNTISDAKRVVGLEYAERVMREDPNSVVAARIWVRCHPSKEQIPAYQKMLSKFPNDAFSHEKIAQSYYIQDYYEEALLHIQKASQLDSRIAKTNNLLFKCYYALGEWEKAIAAYQGLDYFVDDSWGSHFVIIEFPSKLHIAKDNIYRERYGTSILERMK